jgi:hypothetical protein
MRASVAAWASCLPSCSTLARPLAVLVCQSKRCEISCGLSTVGWCSPRQQRSSQACASLRPAETRETRLLVTTSKLGPCEREGPWKAGKRVFGKRVNVNGLFEKLTTPSVGATAHFVRTFSCRRETTHHACSCLLAIKRTTPRHHCMYPGCDETVSEGGREPVAPYAACGALHGSRWLSKTSWEAPTRGRGCAAVPLPSVS